MVAFGLIEIKPFFIHMKQKRLLNWLVTERPMWLLQDGVDLRAGAHSLAACHVHYAVFWVAKKMAFNVIDCNLVTHQLNLNIKCVKFRFPVSLSCLSFVVIVVVVFTFNQELKWMHYYLLKSFSNYFDGP